MHIVITDSGVGGLSVVAYAERSVREHGFREPVKLTFANAAPANDFGYNSMKTREEKLETFDRFLRRVTERFAPDLIYIACNTLSVLLPDTPYIANAATPVKGIVETGAELLARELEADPRSIAMLFGTPTTIEAGAYPRILRARGIEESRIVSQACPGLADTISEDREGSETALQIHKWVGEAISKSERPNAPVIAYLACTHYGYRQELFAAEFDERRIRTTVIDPNARAVDDLFGRRSRGVVNDVTVEFVTRYAIQQRTVEALTFYLRDISPRTVTAMQHFVHVPDLF